MTDQVPHWPLPALADFLAHESDLLDERRFAEWLGLFRADAYYWVPVTPDQRRPEAAPSHIFDSYVALAARVQKFEDRRNIAQEPPSRTCRLLGMPRVVAAAADEVVCRTKFHLSEVRPAMAGERQRPARSFSGVATHTLVRQDNDFRIVGKRVDLIDSETAYEGVSILF
ncbi:MAG: aromatic-ring-hydroxylating dioxygenase subunit beta [Pigmentiphaga sp.]